MSAFRKYNKKRIEESGKNSTSFDENLIQYNDEDEESQFFKLMKKGYIEMGEINLEIAIDSEVELVDINNYETWLCGV